MTVVISKEVCVTERERIFYDTRQSIFNLYLISFIALQKNVNKNLLFMNQLKIAKKIFFVWVDHERKGSHMIP